MRTVEPAAVPVEELESVDGFWRAANYLAVGQIYLMGNPLLTEPLRAEQVKPRLLGHWGTVPGLTFVYAHLNRLIRARDLNVLYVTGPGHGGAAIQAATWLEGTLGEVYSSLPRDETGMVLLFKQFSFPGGMPSHVGPEVPGSIHEGGELGYSLTHAYGAVFDNPDLVAACVVADGEAETGPLATAWHSTKFVDPQRDGAVVPILHLNSYKIGNPTVLARIGDEELTRLLEGYGHVPYLVTGDDPASVHRAMAATLDHVLAEVRGIQHDARERGAGERPRWPMIVLRTPKGWTGPREVDGVPVEGTWRSHQIPLPAPRTDPGQLAALETWMRSYRPNELFDAAGRPTELVRASIPRDERRMGANAHANGGQLVRDIELPDHRAYAVQLDAPGAATASPTEVVGAYIRDVVARTDRDRNFRLFCPDEIESNKLGAVYEVTDRAWNAELASVDVHLARGGRAMEVLSEHTLQGWLEGYLLTGRHGLFASYEAFIHIVDSMFNQHAKWLKVSRELPWRRPVPSLNYLLASHVWQQDHNGFSHQDPGFIDHVVNKKPDVIRVYLPPDANTALAVVDHCLRTRQYVNVVVAGKQPQPAWLDSDQAVLHSARGIGVWEWASNDRGEPDVVLACAGDIPTRETLAAVDLLHRHLPDLRVRVVNVVDLMRLQAETQHPHGLPDAEFDALFTTDRPVVFAYHGYPWLIHRLTYRRTNHDNLHVRGYLEEGTTTTPFDMVVRNNLDRYGLVMDVIDRVPGLGSHAVQVRQAMVDKRTTHGAYIREHGEDLPEVREWRWPG